MKFWRGLTAQNALRKCTLMVMITIVGGTRAQINVLCLKTEGKLRLCRKTIGHVEEWAVTLKYKYFSVFFVLSFQWIITILFLFVIFHAADKVQSLSLSVCAAVFVTFNRTLSRRTKQKNENLPTRFTQHYLIAKICPTRFYYRVKWYEFLICLFRGYTGPDHWGLDVRVFMGVSKYATPAYFFFFWLSF